MMSGRGGLPGETFYCIFIKKFQHFRFIPFFRSKHLIALNNNIAETEAPQFLPACFCSIIIILSYQSASRLMPSTF